MNDELRNMENPTDSLQRKQAAVAVIQREHKLLTIKRSQTVRAPGLICFPGGGVELGETIADALVREMQEELNMAVVAVGEVWRSISSTGFELNWWRAELETGAIITPNQDEVESFQWLTVQEITCLPNLLESNAEFFRALERGEFALG